MNKSCYGHFKDFYELTGEDEIIFKFDYAFISEKGFHIALVSNCRMIMTPQITNPLNRVRLMLQAINEVDGMPQD